MDVNTVPLDAEAMLTGLKRWVELESPTYDKPSVDRMTAMAAEDMETMGFHVEIVPGPEGLGDCAKASFPHPKAGEPGILIMGHLDTVHPLGTLEKLPFRREGNICWGPGICDMKGGNYAAISAIKGYVGVLGAKGSSVDFSANRAGFSTQGAVVRVIKNNAHGPVVHSGY